MKLLIDFSVEMKPEHEFVVNITNHKIPETLKRKWEATQCAL